MTLRDKILLGKISPIETVKMDLKTIVNQSIPNRAGLIVYAFPSKKPSIAYQKSILANYKPFD